MTSYIEELIERLKDEAQELELRAGVNWDQSVETLQLVNMAQDKRVTAAQVEAAFLRDKLKAMGGAA